MPISGMSYASLEYADEFMATQLFDTPWIDSDPNIRVKALVTATDYLNKNYLWTGELNTDTLSGELIASGNLEWPRIDAINSCTDTEIDDDIIPQALMIGTVLEANYLLGCSSAPGEPNLQVSEGITDAKLDVMQVKYDLSSIATNAKVNVPDNVHDVLKCFGILTNTNKNWAQGHTIRA